MVDFHLLTLGSFVSFTNREQNSKTLLSCSPLTPELHCERHLTEGEGPAQGHRMQSTAPPFHPFPLSSSAFFSTGSHAPRGLASLQA